MKTFFCLRWVSAATSMLGLLGACFLISSCARVGGGLADTGYGPFDSRGNYVEAWADNPSKWTRRSFSNDSSPEADDATLLAANDNPPANMTPITSSTSTSSGKVSRVNPTTAISAHTIKSGNATKVSSSGTKPKSSATLATQSTKSKTVASKPRSTRVLVKKGDTLSALAMRHGSSVSAIQRANGMRDTKLAIGRSLVVPRL
ncbi:MAG: hypothetical protein RI957_931 [Verrucomicrobiota bacterium]